MVMIPPASGHVNPMCSLVHELCKQAADLEVFFYSDEEFREAIEQTGALFRRYSHRTFSDLPDQLMATSTNRFCFLIDKMITFSYNLLPQLLVDVQTDRPDLIIYDCFFVTGKHLMNILNSRYQSKLSEIKAPKSVMFFPNFAMNEKIGQKFQENAPPPDIWTPFSFLKIFLRQARFSWSYGLSTYNPIGVFLAKHDHLNLVAVTPELQLYRDEFDESFKFVGPCISEDARNYEIDTNDFELKNLLEMAAKDTNLHLIYMSLGTIFNSSLFIFEKVAQAVCKLAKEQPERKIKLVMSVGEKNLATVRRNVENELKDKKVFKFLVY